MIHPWALKVFVFVPGSAKPTPGGPGEGLPPQEPDCPIQPRQTNRHHLPLRVLLGARPPNVPFRQRARPRHERVSQTSLPRALHPQGRLQGLLPSFSGWVWFDSQGVKYKCWWGLVYLEHNASVLVQRTACSCFSISVITDPHESQLFSPLNPHLVLLCRHNVNLSLTDPCTMRISRRTWGSAASRVAPGPESAVRGRCTDDWRSCEHVLIFPTSR